jgi:hypothetical protein
MTVNYTNNLDLPLPVTGTEPTTWGDIVNEGLTEYLDIAIAGALSISSSVTLANTQGDAGATNITSTTAQYRTLIIPASGPSGSITVTAPSSTRTYHVINLNATHAVQVRAGAFSGVTVNPGQSTTVAYDSVSGDYVQVGPISSAVNFQGTAGTVLTLPAITSSLGYLNIPQNSQSTDYTLVLSDSGKHIFHPSSDSSTRTYTIPANASVPFPIGTVVTFVNKSTLGTITIAITSDTLTLAGSGTTGSRLLSVNGIATCIKITSTEWLISGPGLS